MGPHNSNPGVVVVSPDESLALVGDLAGELALWELATGRARFRVRARRNWVRGAAMTSTRGTR